MQTSVNLQELFSYNICYIIIILVLIIGLTLYILNVKNRKKVIIEIKEINKKDKEEIKRKYIEKLDGIDRQIRNSEITTRIAYQELSKDIRCFVYEMTNIKVQRYTLKEIKKKDMPVLYELIKEYYTPEFARKFSGDIKSSIDKTRKVIEKWN